MFNWKPLVGMIALAAAVSTGPAHLSAATEAPAVETSAPAVAHKADCSWTGTWGSAFSRGETITQLVVVIQQSGADVAGGYAYLENPSQTGTFVATVVGPLAVGAWGEGESTGRFALAISDDCNTWAGTWGNGDSTDNGGAWAGQRAG